MVRNWLKAAMGTIALVAIPAFSQAQSNNSTSAKLGSKDNPIPVTAVGTPVPNNKSKGKGKRGSKSNPITGQTHTRNSN